MTYYSALPGTNLTLRTQLSLQNKSTYLYKNVTVDYTMRVPACNASE